MAGNSPTFPEIAAVDLGSNSFRLQLARVVDDHLIFHDSLRESVRLGAGLNEKKELSPEAQARAINCLKKFGERLRGMPEGAVRAVATNTFRVAKNSAELLQAAEAALGFPIEIIAGIEEARMIFIGVSHGLPKSSHRRLIIDIGGGSTEFIVGQDLTPRKMESLYMGCVSFSLKFFPEGKISESNFKKAELAAAAEIQNIVHAFNSQHWDEAIGSSGTAKSLGDILRLNQFTDGSVTIEGLEKLKTALIKAKDVKNLQLEGLSPERAAVIPGGLSIMLAAFKLLGIKKLAVSSSALREGVLYELLGRLHNEDTRNLTVESFMRRYHVDRHQAERVKQLALNLFEQIDHDCKLNIEAKKQHLIWASQLHEIGISIAHSGYHKHSSYIVENADMPGFSRIEQEAVASLVRAQRRSLSKVTIAPVQDKRCALTMVFRLAVLFNRSRLDTSPPKLALKWGKNDFSLEVEKKWLKQNPLTEQELYNEVDYWKAVDICLKIKSL
jgi:exopolyphosphatase/guanosine-5'-triphosphate,3'-diphosphate pyrophosphatase